MPEAEGQIIVVFQSFDSSEIEFDDECITEDGLVTLFNASGIESLDELALDEPLYHQGIDADNNFIYFHIFGDEWMELASIIVEQGSGVELYGNIFQEHGALEYYALDLQGNRFIECLDLESDASEEDAQEIRNDWLSLIPTSIKEKFPSLINIEY